MQPICFETLKTISKNEKKKKSAKSDQRARTAGALFREVFRITTTDFPDFPGFSRTMHTTGTTLVAKTHAIELRKKQVPTSDVGRVANGRSLRRLNNFSPLHTTTGAHTRPALIRARVREWVCVFNIYLYEFYFMDYVRVTYRRLFHFAAYFRILGARLRAIEEFFVFVLVG